MKTDTAIETPARTGSEPQVRSSEIVSLPARQPDCYVGRKKCGCLVAVVVDDARYKKDTAKTVADFIKKGYLVQSAVWNEVKGEFKKCKCQHEKAG